MKRGATQEILLLSYPSGTNVTAGGENIGKTPLTIELSTKIGHELRFNMPGYQENIIDVLPHSDNASERNVTFGLAEQRGSYNTLSPNPVIAVLNEQSGKKTDPYEAMVSLVEMNDQWHKAGKISDQEHKRITDAILSHFN